MNEQSEPDGPVTVVAVYPVRDYDTWCSAIHESRERLTARGVTVHTIYRSVDDTNEVLIAMEIATREGAEQLLADPDEVRAFFADAGVEIYPAVFVGRQAERIDYSRSEDP